MLFSKTSVCQHKKSENSRVNLLLLFSYRNSVVINLTNIEPSNGGVNLNFLFSLPEDDHMVAKHASPFYKTFDCLMQT